MRSPARRAGGGRKAGPGRPRVVIRPLTPERWADLEKLFGARGACGGCWCMWWRRRRSEFERGKEEGNRRAFRRIVASGQVPGLLAYVGGEPAGWCAVGPRDAYPVLDRSRVLARLDAEPVWSVVCFFVARAHRGRGLAGRLLEAAVAHAGRRGARVVEGYPVEPCSGRMPDVFAWTGLAVTFRRARFREAARRSATRPIFRRRT